MPQDEYDNLESAGNVMRKNRPTALSVDLIELNLIIFFLHEMINFLEAFN